MRLKARLTQSAHRFIQFGEYDPDPGLAKQEQTGSDNWTGGELDYIRSTSPFPLPPLPYLMQKMLDHAWKAANPSQGAARGPVQIGAQRQTPLQIGAQRQPGFTAPYQKIKTAPIKMVSAEHLQSAFARDWKTHNDFKRVRAFSFRGDKRSALEVEKAGGFSPPITRTDDYYMKETVHPQFARWLKDQTGVDIGWEEFRKAVMQGVMDPANRLAIGHYATWRLMVENEQFHMGRMIAEQALKGFISTTRAAKVAKGYAASKDKAGCVYVTQVDGGYLIPRNITHEWVMFGEQEIAMPGRIPWDKVMGFRQVTTAARFTGPIYLRDTFVSVEVNAAEEAYQLLSGKRQS